jgi:hypothetical protein
LIARVARPLHLVFAVRQRGEDVMQYEIVKEDNLYIIVVEGRSIMKFKTRRQAARVLAAAFDADSLKSDDCEPDAPTAQSGDSGTNDSLSQSAGFLRKAQ